MKMQVRAWIRGSAMTPFVSRSTSTFAELGQSAVLRALKDADVAVDDVDQVICGTGYGGPLSGQRIASNLGLTGPRVLNVENACSSGVAALAVATEAIESGRARTVVAVGIDRLSALGRGALPLEPSDVEVQQGAIMPAVYAMRAQRYLAETGARPEDLAAVTVKARENGARNPFAQMTKPTTVEAVMASRLIADPLTLYMCCPRGDGAAAVVLSANPPGDARPAVGLRAVALQSGRYTDGYRDMTRSELSERTIAEAYREAGVTPDDIDLAETHDAFAIAEIMYYEALGLAERGQGWRLIRDGATGIDGRVAVNPGGGLLARGHPVGATGVAQVVEAYWQLAEMAGDRQLDGAATAVTHCTGGGIAGFDHGSSGATVLGRA